MMFDALSAQDKEMIEYYIQNYGGYEANSHPESAASLRYILRYWDMEKKTLYGLLGEQLIVSKHINYEKSIDDLMKEISHEINTNPDMYNFIQEIKELARKINEPKLPLICYSPYYLALNSYDALYPFFITTPSGKKIIINNKCKVIKVLGKIAKEFNLQHYEAFRIAHSQILNQKKLKGNLCLSIHPLDFMTMSDNACGWTSCMSWQDEGCYRRGTVEMMNSPVVLMAYLDSENPFYINGYKWNNKKWRELYIVNKDLITHIKGYPYENDSLTKQAMSWIKELAETNLNWNYCNKLQPIVIYDHTKIDNRKCHIDFRTNTMYNDFAGEHMFYLTDQDIYANYTLNYSGVDTCLYCGSVEADYRDDSFLLCDKCQRGYYCECCGEWFSDDEMSDIMFDGLRICKECYETQTYSCAQCGKLHMKFHMNSIYIRKDEHYLYDCPFYLCNECLEKKPSSKFIGLHSISIDECDDDIFVNMGFLSKEDFIHSEHGVFKV